MDLQTAYAMKHAKRARKGYASALDLNYSQE